MIPAIGLMVASYIITRMLSVLTRTGDRTENLLVRVFAIITICVTVLMSLTLITAGAGLDSGNIR